MKRIQKWAFFQQRPLSLQEVGALPQIYDCKYLCQLHKWQGHQVPGSLGFSNTHSWLLFQTLAKCPLLLFSIKHSQLTRLYFFIRDRCVSRFHFPPTAGSCRRFCFCFHSIIVGAAQCWCLPLCGWQQTVETAPRRPFLPAQRTAAAAARIQILCRPTLPPKHLLCPLVLRYTVCCYPAHFCRASSANPLPCPRRYLVLSHTLLPCQKPHALLCPSCESVLDDCCVDTLGHARGATIFCPTVL